MTTKAWPRHAGVFVAPGRCGSQPDHQAIWNAPCAALL